MTFTYPIGMEHGLYAGLSASQGWAEEAGTKRKHDEVEE